MKRRKQCENTRHYKSGKKTTVNPGVKKRLKSYGMGWSNKTGYPIFDHPESVGKKGKKGKLVKLQPEDFLRLANNSNMPLSDFIEKLSYTDGDETESVNGVYNSQSLKDAILSKDKKVPLVGIEFKEGLPSFIEGRHRAVAAYKSNIALPTVIVTDPKTRTLKRKSGKDYVDLPSYKRLKDFEKSINKIKQDYKIKEAKRFKGMTAKQIEQQKLDDELLLMKLKYGIKKRKNYSSLPKQLYHGTSEESLAKMGFTGGLKPSNGKLYLTDDPNYARLKGRQSTENKPFKPVTLVIDTPDDIRLEGRHYITEQTIPINKIKRVEFPTKNYGSSPNYKLLRTMIRNLRKDNIINQKEAEKVRSGKNNKLSIGDIKRDVAANNEKIDYLNNKYFPKNPS